MEKTIYDFRVKNAEGEDYSLAGLKGKAVLIVNVASKCGFTPQYEGLEALPGEDRAQKLSWKLDEISFAARETVSLKISNYSGPSIIL